jgi:hypothetical protein
MRLLYLRHPPITSIAGFYFMGPAGLVKLAYIFRFFAVPAFINCFVIQIPGQEKAERVVITWKNVAIPFYSHALP